MKWAGRVAVPLLLGILHSQLVRGAMVQNPTALDSFGGRSTGGGYTLDVAAGQQGGVGVAGENVERLFAGFLYGAPAAGFSPLSVHGIPVELDPDNDADGLEDEVELAGSGFDPQTVTDHNEADSDGDGAGDGDEAVAGTNPQDENAYLHFKAYVPLDENGHRATWEGRAGRTYRVMAGTNLNRRQDFVVLDELTAPGPGVGLWQTVPVDWTNTALGADRAFLFLRLVP